jgi:DNA-directed RNA polymerase subunit M/transcription elongation factor TFIIS
MAKCLNCKNQTYWAEYDGERLLLCRVCGKYYDVVNGKLAEYIKKVEVKKENVTPDQLVRLRRSASHPKTK